MILEQVFFSVVERSLCVGVILLLLCVFARLWQAHSAPPVRRVLWILLSLCLLAAAYAVLLFVSPAAAPIGVTLTVVGLVLVSTRYAWRAKFLALFNEA